MKNFYFLLLLSLFAFSQKGKNSSFNRLKHNTNVNFYTVCDSAEAYFNTIDKTKKGSGYKEFLRWKNDNEPRYAPSGNRMVNHYMPYEEYERIKNESTTGKNESILAGNQWSCIGPFQINDISGHYAVGLGRLEYVEVNKNNKQQIYLGSRSGGLWRTNDEGATWIHNTDFLPASGVDYMAAMPTNFNYLIFNVRNSSNGYSHGIYKTTDGGVTISPTNFVPANVTFGGLGSNFVIQHIKYHPTIPNLVFVGTNKGLYRSTDNLQTWTRLSTYTDVWEIDFHPSNSSIIYIYSHAYKNRILKSTDTGLTFTTMPILANNLDAYLKITTVASEPNNIYVSSDNGIWKSTDAGVTFSVMVNPAPAGVSLTSCMPNNLDTTNFVGGYVDCYRSIDNAVTFTQATAWSLGNTAFYGTADFMTKFNTATKYIHADIDYLDCVNGIFYACTDGFLAKSEDKGETWQKLNMNMSIRENYSLGISQSNNSVLITGSQDNGTTIKNENGWVESYGGDGMECIVHPLNYEYMVGSSQYGGRYQYLNGRNANSITPDGGANAYWEAPLLFDPNDHMRLYTFHTMVKRSDDFGTTWVDLGTPALFAAGNINRAAIAYNNSNIMAMTQGSNIVLSNDGGNTFVSITNGLPSNTITDLTFDPNNDNTIYVTYSSYLNNGNKIFVSTNSGASWQNITYNLGNMPIWAITVSKSDGMIYAGAEIGVYRKTAASTTWSLFNDQLPNVAITDLEINYGSNTLKASTWGRGSWEAKLFGRENHPSIEKTVITNQPTFNLPKATVPQYVTSTINYSGTLTNVRVAWAVGSPNFNGTNVIPMSLVSGNIWKSNAPLPDQAVGTKMYFKVIATGSSGDTSETYKFMYEVKPFLYCDAAGSYTRHITRFKCSNVDNVTANTVYTHYSTPEITMFKGESYNTIATFTSLSSINETDFYIWIDFNNDADFSEDEKLVSLVNIPYSTNPTINPIITIPSSVNNGTYRMRVRLGYYQLSSTPCGTSDGEVEDYTVTILDKPTITFSGNSSYCLNSNVSLNYTGSPVSSLSWTLTNGIDSYNFTGNTVNTTSLPVGNYSVLINYVVNGANFSELFPDYFIVSKQPTAVDITNVNEAICANTTKQLNATGGNFTDLKFKKESGEINQAVPDNNLTTGNLQVFNVNTLPANAVITKVEVKLNVNHTQDRDLRINLEAPNGKIVNLYNQHGDIGDNLTNTVITSDATAPAFTNVATAAPFTGTFRASLANQTTIATTPAVNSTLFSDLFTVPNGDWKLRIYDDSGSGFYGTYLNSTLIITYSSNQQIVWSPITNLFLDASLTLPYTTNTIATTVYAKPTSTVTYTAKAYPDGCPIFDNVTLTTGVVNKFISNAWTNGTPPTTGGVNTLEFDNATGYNSTTDISGCSCVVKQGNVKINNGHTLVLQNEVNVIGGSLTLENGAALLQNNIVSNTGNIIVKRNSTPMIRLDYTAWGSPVTGQQLLAFSPNTLTNRFYEYLYTGTTTATAFVSVNPNNNFINGKGYMIRSANNWPTTPTVFNGQFTGVPYNGNLTMSVGLGYNLLSNPYPSPIFANDLLNLNPNIGTLYFWTHNVSQNTSYVAQTNYASYTLLGGTAAIAGGITPNGKIGIGQGFFIRANSGSSVNFNNSIRRKATADTQFFRAEEEQVLDRYWLNLTSNTLPYNEILIGYTESSSLNFDQNIDGLLLETDRTSIYSNSNNEKLVIQGRGSFNVNDIVSLGVKVNELGQYKISLGNIEGVFTTQNIYLHDKQIGLYHDLKNMPYEFNCTELESNSRFEIVYASALSHEEFNTSLINIYPNPYKNGSKLEISNLNEKCEIAIYDINGRLIFEKENVINNVILPNMQSGTYLVKINSETFKVTKKLIVE